MNRRTVMRQDFVYKEGLWPDLHILWKTSLLWRTSKIFTLVKSMRFYVGIEQSVTRGHCPTCVFSCPRFCMESKSIIQPQTSRQSLCSTWMRGECRYVTSSHVLLKGCLVVLTHAGSPFCLC